jgi:hypothetical protein
MRLVASPGEAGDAAVLDDAAKATSVLGFESLLVIER